MIINKKDEKEWDGNGRQLWSYFSENAKKRICYFFSERLNGKNLEVGGGGYLHYPNSTVIDLSNVCLEYNIAKEKIQFDLDTIGKGAKLPFKSNTFNSATMISVWQYMAHPDALVKELQRVIKPGGELYIINGENGKGVEKCVKNTHKPRRINEYFQKKGFDTIIENIPSKSETINYVEFKSVCVSMPQKNIFGEKESIIKYKKKRIEKTKDLQTFFKNYIDWSIKNRIKLFKKIPFVPITKYYKDYLINCENFSQEFYKKTKNIPLLSLNYNTPYEIYMMTRESYNHPSLEIIGEEKKLDYEYNIEKQIEEKYNVRFGGLYGFLSNYNKNNLINNCKNNNISTSEFNSLVNFLAKWPFNSFTKILQKEVFNSLKIHYNDLNQKIMKNKAVNYTFVTSEFDQRNKMEKVLHQRDNIIKKEIPIIGSKYINYKKFIPYFSEIIK